MYKITERIAYRHFGPSTCVHIYMYIYIYMQEFNPEKYNHLADIFGHAYLSSGTPVSIVSHFLSAFTKGQVAAPPEACEPFVAKSYDIRKAYVACSFKGERGSSTLKVMINCTKSCWL